MNNRIGYTLFGTVDGFEHKSEGLMGTLGGLDSVLDINSSFAPTRKDQELYVVYKISSKSKGWITLFCLYQYALRREGSFRGGEHIGVCIGVAGRVSKSDIKIIYTALIELMQDGRMNCSRDGRFEENFNIKIFSSSRAEARLQTISSFGDLSYVNLLRSNNTESLILLDASKLSLPEIFHGIQEEYYGEKDKTIYLGKTVNIEKDLQYMNRINIKEAAPDQVLNKRNVKIGDLNHSLIKLRSDNSLLKEENKKLSAEIRLLNDSHAEYPEIIRRLEKQLRQSKKEVSLEKNSRRRSEYELKKEKTTNKKVQQKLDGMTSCNPRITNAHQVVSGYVEKEGEGSSSFPINNILEKDESKNKKDDRSKWSFLLAGIKLSSQNNNDSSLDYVNSSNGVGGIFLVLVFVCLLLFSLFYLIDDYVKKNTAESSAERKSDFLNNKINKDTNVLNLNNNREIENANTLKIEVSKANLDLFIKNSLSSYEYKNIKISFIGDCLKSKDIGLINSVTMMKACINMSAACLYNEAYNLTFEEFKECYGKCGSKLSENSMIQCVKDANSVLKNDILEGQSQYDNINKITIYE